MINPLSINSKTNNYKTAQINFKAANCLWELPQDANLINSVNPLSVNYREILMKVKELLDGFSQFGLKEYKQLSDENKSLFRTAFTPLKPDELNALSWINRNNKAYSLPYAEDNYFSCNSFLKSIMKTADIMKSKLNTVFPNGFVIGSIGRSPAAVSSVLEHQGYKVAYFPISNLGPGRVFVEKVPIGLVKETNNHLKLNNLTMEEIEKSSQTVVFTDYTKWGWTLKNFKNLLEMGPIGIKQSDKVKFLSLNEDIIQGRNEFDINPLGINKSKIDNIASRMELDSYKDYSPIPQLDYQSIEMGSMQKAIDAPQAYYKQKIMQFLILDKLNSKGLLKDY